MSASSSIYQPDSPPPLSQEQLDRAHDLLSRGPVAILTGAGCSTESGIPDYRGPKTPNVPGQRLVHYHPFVHDRTVRQRYWARTYVGWSWLIKRRPNPAHHGLRRLESIYDVRGLVTQNVDGLHHEAGSSSIVELHGSMHLVRCIECNRRWPREQVQAQITADNEGLLQAVGDTRIFADADAEVEEHLISTFVPPTCCDCGAPLKPAVIFFGENIPAEASAAAAHIVTDVAALLVVGTSLYVPSGRRLVDRALTGGAQLIVVNVGPTWADDKAHLLLPGIAGEVVTALASSAPKA